MSLRRITSLTALFTFLMMILTSVVLYIVPEGRVANWAVWKLWGLTKEQWGQIHINMGFLFILTLLLHTYYNWKMITAYLKNRARQMKIFTREFNVALILTLAFILGTYAGIPPFSTITHLNDSMKDAGARKYGDPPYGHAELSSLKTFTARMGIDLTDATARLQTAGYEVASENQSLADLSQINRVSPQQVYTIIKPATKKDTAYSGPEKELPEQPPSGMGQMLLADLAAKYNLNLKVLVRSLSDQNLKVAEDLTIKNIAETNNIDPQEVYQAIRTISAKPPSPEKSPTGGGEGTGMGRKTLTEICEENALPLEAALKKLSTLGIKANPGDKIRDLAGQINISPLDLVDQLKK